ncbi:MAG: hypothetical protein ABR574_11240 [Cryomorphaceae bacterium]|nr:hypothetical protein [Flavobacteriales bacterium]
MKKLTLFLAIVLISLGCEKDDNTSNPTAGGDEGGGDAMVEVVNPGSYFPVFPGSWWTYTEYDMAYEWIDGTYTLTGIDTSETTDEVSPDYLPHAYITNGEIANENPEEGYSDTVMVPFFNGEPIYRYSRVDFKSQAPESYELYPFLSENVGDTLETEFSDPRFDYLGPFVVVLNKTVDSQNDSIIELKRYYSPGFNGFFIDWYTYKKDVGLVSHYTTSTSTNDTVYARVLTDYEVGE